MTAFVIALVTDTHVRPEYDDGQRAYPSDSSHNDRNRAAAEAIRRMSPDLVVHLGDVVHPIPTLPAHNDALMVAADIYTELGARLIVAPGNHDVGDKRTGGYAPAHVEQGREAFRKAWGAPFQSIDVGGIHIVIIDGGLLGADTDESILQWSWLESDLSGTGLRSFVFMHYPAFLVDPDEDEHYDNLRLDVRTRLLELFVANRVEAVFSGHVHRFFLNQHSGVDLVSLPSVAFTRPEYSALRTAPPADDEHGRDDPEHLGVCRLEINDHGYTVDFVKLNGTAPGPPAPIHPLGVWLRHRLGRRTELPYGDLDALDRKVARDEGALLQVIDLGLSWVRVPLADLEDPDVRFRLVWLQRHGASTLVFSGGLPTPKQRELHEHHGRGSPWEVVIGDHQIDPLLDRLSDWHAPGLIVGRIGKTDAVQSRYFSHFPREGLHPEHPDLDRLAAAAGVVGIAFRIAAEGPVAEQISSAVQRARTLGVQATCHVELPFGTEALAQTNDALVEERVIDAARSAIAHPDARVMLDLLVDKDRGYWCRHGLVDPSGWPRSAYVALKSMDSDPCDRPPGGSDDSSHGHISTGVDTQQNP